MRYVALFQIDRTTDLQFWSVFWQGQGPPEDFTLIGAYNLMTDLRVIVFDAETTASIRWLDRLNLTGKITCHPALDQTDAYQAVVARDHERFAAFLRRRHRGAQCLGCPHPRRRVAGDVARQWAVGSGQWAVGTNRAGVRPPVATRRAAAEIACAHACPVRPHALRLPTAMRHSS